MSSHPFRSLPTVLTGHLPDDPRAQRAEAFYEHLSAVYSLAQDNSHVFASPLGPVAFGGRQVWLPRFVFFGPNTTDASWRLAFLGGFDREDLRASHALLGLVQFLGRNANEGYGLNLTFFPLVDVAGHVLHAPPRPLATAHWARSDLPEIALLERDARGAGYHGYVRVESAVPGEEIIVARMRSARSAFACPDVELISSDELAPYPFRFESAGYSTDGPLTLADDLAVQPFELTLRIPPTWTNEVYFSAVNTILSRFILRYRAFQAFGGHL